MNERFTYGPNTSSSLYHSRRRVCKREKVTFYSHVFVFKNTLDTVYTISRISLVTISVQKELILHDCRERRTHCLLEARESPVTFT